MNRYFPVVTVKDPKDVIPTLQALRDYGINCAEITFRTSFAKQAIEEGVKAFPDMEIGAGSVHDCKTAMEAIEAGAKFVFSAGFSAEVAKVCQRAEVPYVPGIATATELVTAVNAGCMTVKFFPAELLGGVKMIKALSAPFPQVKFIPTGGVDRSNMDEYLALPQVVGVGGSFFVKEALAKEKEKE